MKKTILLFALIVFFNSIAFGQDSQNYTDYVIYLNGSVSTLDSGSVIIKKTYSMRCFQNPNNNDPGHRQCQVYLGDDQYSITNDFIISSEYGIIYFYDANYKISAYLKAYKDILNKKTIFKGNANFIGYSLYAVGRGTITIK